MEREYRYSLRGLHICIKQGAGTGDNIDNNGGELVSGTNSRFFLRQPHSSLPASATLLFPLISSSAVDSTPSPAITLSLFHSRPNT